MGLIQQNRSPVNLTADYSHEFLCDRDWCGDQGEGAVTDKAS